MLKVALGSFYQLLIGATTTKTIKKEVLDKHGEKVELITTETSKLSPDFFAVKFTLEKFGKSIGWGKNEDSGKLEITIYKASDNPNLTNKNIVIPEGND